MKETLLEMGFTNNETTVYLTLLNVGQLSAGILASKCEIHRRTVYDVLERLSSKGVVGYIKENGVKLYSATNPNELLNILKKKEKNVRDILPQLKEMHNRTKSKKTTNFYRGKEGLRFIFEDQIRQKEEVLVIGGSNKVYDLLKYYIPHYERQRKKYGIRTKLIFDCKEQVEIPNSKIRYVGHSLGPTAINIYGNKVAIIVWDENPYAILIDDDNVAKSYREHFEIMWKVAK